MAGQHAGGAARTAKEFFGAVEGVGRGWAGQSFAIPTMNEHLQQMPLSQIQHYVDDFKIYAKNHPKMKYFLTSIGCGIAGYTVEEIAPMFKGIAHNVIFPSSFRPFVEKALPKLTQKLLHTIYRDSVIFTPATDELIEVLALSDNEKALAKIILNTQMYPTDSNGRDRVFEIQDILHNLNGKVSEFQNNSEGQCYLVQRFWLYWNCIISTSKILAMYGMAYVKSRRQNLPTKRVSMFVNFNTFKSPSIKNAT